MSNLLEKIKETIESIKNHPDIIVDELTINGPLTQNLAESFETVAGIGVPADIKELYLEANGITFIWRVKPGLDKAKMQHFREKIGDDGYDFNKPLGAIRIVPLQDMMLNSKWTPPKETDPNAKEPFSFGNKEYTHQSFGQTLRPFDFYYVDNDAQCMAFIVTPGSPEYKYEVMMLDDYFADWKNSYITDFKTYIEAICTTQFVIPARKRLFSKYRGDKETALAFESLNKAFLEPVL